MALTLQQVRTLPEVDGLSDKDIITHLQAHGFDTSAMVPAERIPTSTLSAYGQTLKQAVKQIPAYVASAIEGSTPYDSQNKLDQLQSIANTQQHQFEDSVDAHDPSFAGLASVRDIKQTAPSLAGSIAGMAPSVTGAITGARVGAGLGTVAGLPGAAVGGTVGGLVGAGIGLWGMKRAAENQFVKAAVEKENVARAQQGIPPLTQQENIHFQNALDVSGDTAKMGLAEALPETAGNLIETAVLATPIGKFGKSLATLGSPLGKALTAGLMKSAATFATEGAEEEITRQLQNPILQKHGFPEQTTAETLKQTAIATTPFAAFGFGAGAYQSVKKQPDIPSEHPSDGVNRKQNQELGTDAGRAQDITTDSKQLTLDHQLPPAQELTHSEPLSPIDNQSVNDKGLQGSQNTSEGITADQPDIRQDLQNNVESAKKDLSKNQTSPIKTATPETRIVTPLSETLPSDPLVKVTDKQSGKSFHVLQSDLASTKPELVKHSLISGKRLPTPILRQDIIEEQSNPLSSKHLTPALKKVGLAITRAATIENRTFNDMPGMYSQGSEHQGLDIHSITQTKDANGNPDYIVHASNRRRVASNGHKTTEGNYSLNELLNSGAISQKTNAFLVNEHHQGLNSSSEINNDHELTAQQYVDRKNKGFSGNKQINDSLRKAHYTAIRSHLDQGGKISQEVFDSLDGLRRTNLKKNYGEGVVQAPVQENAKSSHDTIDVSKKVEKVDAYHPAIKSLANDLLVGGGVGIVTNKNDVITGRTPSLNPEWFKDGAFITLDDKGNQTKDKSSVKDIQTAVDDHYAGKRLTPKQKRILSSLSNVAHELEQAGNNSHPEYYDYEQSLLDNDLQSKLVNNEISIDDVQSALDQFDDSIPFDVKGDNLSIQQLDDFFGITNEERKSERSATGDTQEALTGYPEAELATKEREQKQRDSQATDQAIADKQSPEHLKAQADFIEALSDVGIALSDKTSFNAVPSEVDLEKAVKRLVVAAFKLGYIKLSDNVNHVIEKLKAKFGNAAAHIDESYISKIFDDVKKDLEGRNAVTGDLNRVNKDVRDAVNEFLSRRPIEEQTRIKDNLNAHSGTAWAAAAVKGMAYREMLHRAMEGRSIDNLTTNDIWGGQNMANTKIIKAFKQYIRFGDKAIHSLINQYDFIGGNRKAENDVSTSFANCNPSDECAVHCYAAGSNARPNEIAKSEFTEFVLENYLKDVADRIALTYRMKQAGVAGLSLRLNDKGDLSEAQVQLISKLNDKDIVLQIFSKRPDLLRKIPDANLKMLSIDSSNMAIAKENPGLRLAVVITDGMTEAMLEPLHDRVSVYLPVNLKGKSVSTEELKSRFPNLYPKMKRDNLCPVDGGGMATLPGTSFVDIKNGINKDAKEKVWTCTACDLYGAAGCFNGDRQTTQRNAATQAQNIQLSDVKKELAIKNVKIELHKQLDLLTQLGEINGKQHEEISGILSSGRSDIRIDVNRGAETGDLQKTSSVSSGQQESGGRTGRNDSGRGETGRVSGESKEVKFSKSNTPVTNPHSKTSLNQSITNAMDSLFCKGWTHRLMATDKFKLINSSEAVLIAGNKAIDAKGFYNFADDTTYLVHDNMDKALSAKALQGLMLHEIGTHALRLGQSHKIYQDILRRFELLKKTHVKVQAAFDSVPKGTKPEDIVEEALAHYVEENPTASLAQQFIEWFRQAVRAIGKALVGKDQFLFSQWTNKLTEAELIDMAASALKSAPDNLQFDVALGEEVGSTRVLSDSKNQVITPSTPNVDLTLGQITDKHNRIKFSRPTPSNTVADNKVMRSVFSKAEGKQALSWLAGLFQRNHLIDFVAQNLPELINYKLLSQAKDNFTHQREQEIAKSYEAMMEKLNKKTMHELGRVQGLATRLADFDPAEANNNDPMTAEERNVFEAYEALPEGAKEVYASMRDAYQADLQEKKAALIERIKAFPVDRETQGKIIKTIEVHFDQFLKGVYFPLNRDGGVIVKATNAEGELVVEHVASQADAYKLVKEMTAQSYYNTHIIGKDAYDRDLLAGQSANDMAVLAQRTMTDLREKSTQGKLTDADFNALFSEFNQLLIATLPDSSYRKHFIHRQGTLGESTDTLRAYAKTRTSAVKAIASLIYDHQIQAVLNDADKTIKDMDQVPGSDTLALKSILNELKLREAALKSTEINAASQVLTSLGFMGALGFNIGSAAVNLLQVTGVALPELVGRHSYREATTEIAKAYQLLFNPAVLNKASGFDITQHPRISAPTKQALEQLGRMGKIDLTMTHDAIAMGKNSSYSSNQLTRVLGGAAKYSGYLFHVAEAVNRQITGMAAFNLAYKKNGGDFDAAVSDAEDVIDRTQFDYGQGNRARYMMSNTARVLTLFKSYALGMSYFIGRSAALSINQLDSAERQQARKTLVASMAMSFATAGLFGMPIGLEAFAGIGGVAGFKYKGANFAMPGAIGGMLIFQALLAGLGADDEDELETEFRNWLTDNFDQTTAEWVTKGPARLLPIGDISGRTDTAHLWWRPQNKQLEGTDQYNAIANAIIGPIGSQIAGLFTAKKMYEDGEYARMLEAMSPAFLRNAIAANRMGEEGVRNLKGDRLIERELTATELINKVIGFNPKVVANSYDANAAIAKERDKINMAKAHLVNRYIDSDIIDRNVLMQGDIKQFNETVQPAERITLKSLILSMKRRKGLNKQTQNGLYLSRKQAYLRSIGRFAERQ